MNTRLLTIIIAATLVPSLASAQATTDIAEPFKVGTVEINGAAPGGIDLRDSLILDLTASNARC